MNVITKKLEELDDKVVKEAEEANRHRKFLNEKKEKAEKEILEAMKDLKKYGFQVDRKSLSGDCFAHVRRGKNNSIANISIRYFNEPYIQDETGRTMCESYDIKVDFVGLAAESCSSFVSAPATIREGLATEFAKLINRHSWR